MKIAIQIVEMASGAYRAQSRAMPGCVALGGTAEQARRKMLVEVHGYLSSMNVACPADLEVVVAEEIREMAQYVDDRPTRASVRLNSTAWAVG